MAHNPRIRADLPAWQAAVPLEPEECDAIDAAQFASINGDAGGAWAPAAAIEIGGAGVEHSGPVAFKTGGAFLIENGVICSMESTGQISSDLAMSPPRLQFTGIGQFNVWANGLIKINTGGEAQVKSGGKLDVQTGGVQSVSGDLDVESGGVVTVKSGGDVVVESGGELSVESGATLSIAATAAHTGAVTFSGPGGALLIPGEINATNANKTLDLSNGKRTFYNPNGVFGANRQWGVPDSFEGDEVTIVNADTAYEVQVVAGLSLTPLLYYTGNPFSVRLKFLGGFWRNLGYGRL